MDILRQLHEELNEAKLTKKALAEKYPNLHKLFGSLYTFSEPLSDNRSDRGSKAYGIYDMDADQVVLPAEYVFKTFGKEHKNNPSYEKSKFLEPYCIVYKSEGKSNEYGRDVHRPGKTNIFLLQSRKFLLPSGYDWYKNTINLESGTYFTFEAGKKYVTIDHNANIIYKSEKFYDAREHKLVEGYGEKRTIIEEGIGFTNGWGSKDVDLYLPRKKKVFNLKGKLADEWMFNFNGQDYILSIDNDSGEDGYGNYITNADTGELIKTVKTKYGNAKTIQSHGKLYLKSMHESIEVFGDERHNPEDIHDEIIAALAKKGYTEDMFTYGIETITPDMIPVGGGYALACEDIFLNNRSSKYNQVHFVYSTRAKDFVWISENNDTPIGKIFSYIHLYPNIHQMIHRIFEMGND